MNLSSIFPNIQRVMSGTTDTVDRGAIGTVEEPLIAHPLLHVPTGRAAQQSAQDRWKNFQKNEDKDAFLPISARQQRRAAQAASRRQAKRGTRAFKRRELLKETAASDLANLFNQIDGHIKVDPIARLRARNAIAARVKFLRDQQQAQYDRQIAARGGGPHPLRRRGHVPLRQKDRDLPAPGKVASHEEIEAQLRAVAKTARLPLSRSVAMKARRAAKRAAA